MLIDLNYGKIIVYSINGTYLLTVAIFGRRQNRFMAIHIITLNGTLSGANPLQY